MVALEMNEYKVPHFHEVLSGLNLMPHQQIIYD